MFSSRTDWIRTPNPLSVLLEQRRREGKPVIDLTLSNPTEAALDYPSAVISRIFSESASAAYDPEAFGLRSAREAVAGYYRRKGREVGAERIVLTASTSEAYTHLFRLLCEPGDTVLVPVPSYPLFDFLSRLNDVQMSPFRFLWEGAWHLDAGSLRAAAEGGAKALVLVNPNNPTGAYLKRDEWNQVREIARRSGMAVIVDEVFLDYPFGDDERRNGTTAGEDGCLTFTLGGISKLAGMPHLKLGWIVVGGGEDECREALGRLEIIADTYLSVNTPVQAGLPGLLQAGEGIRSRIAERTRANLAVLRRDHLSASGCTAVPVEGGWYAVLRVPRVLTDEEWAMKLLAEEGVYMHPGFFYSFPDTGTLVLSLLPPPAEFEAGVQALVRTVRRVV